jgi:aryl-alcohol dehydrogenase-like predicted oxidoreductase
LPATRRQELGPNDRRLSGYHIRRACEASLRRLQTDHNDLYQMHQVDRATPWEEIWQAMEQLVRDGKISYVSRDETWVELEPAVVR